MRSAWLLLLLLSLRAAAFDAILSGSASVDYRFISGLNPPENPSPLGITGLTFEVAQKVVAEVGHGVSFTVKACGGCHGIEVDQGFGEVRLKRLFNVRIGRINVPFGEFTLRHDPANFSTPSKPLPYAMGDMLHYGPEGFNLGIVPAPYVDNGVEAFGSFSFGRSQLDYAVYVVKGLGGDNDFDFARSRSYLDNNRSPAFGGRVVLTGEDWAVGASVSAGAYDPKDSLWYVIPTPPQSRSDSVALRSSQRGRRGTIGIYLSARLRCSLEWRNWARAQRPESRSGAGAAERCTSQCAAERRTGPRRSDPKDRAGVRVASAQSMCTVGAHAPLPCAPFRSSLGT